VWESFNAGDRRLIEAVAAGEYAQSLAEFNTNNALSLRKLRDEGAVLEKLQTHASVQKSR
jgi:hypothetical protein